MGKDGNPPTLQIQIRISKHEGLWLKTEEKHYLGLVRKLQNPDTTTGLREVWLGKTGGWPHSSQSLNSIVLSNSPHSQETWFFLGSQSLVRTRVVWKSSLGDSFLTGALCWGRNMLQKVRWAHLKQALNNNRSRYGFDLTESSEGLQHSNVPGRSTWQAVHRGS